jgi:prefoldin subunit 5
MATGHPPKEHLRSSGLTKETGELTHIAEHPRADSSNAVLVPLTNSLYVRGQLTNTERVLVDVGTGFLVDKVRLIP